MTMPFGSALGTTEKDPGEPIASRPHDFGFRGTKTRIGDRLEDTPRNDDGACWSDPYSCPAALLAEPAAQAASSDWPQYCGPNRDGNVRAGMG